MKKYAVILSGCGSKDGSEIHESTMILLAIKQLIIVPKTGLEPARCETHAAETGASTNSATWARFQYAIARRSKYERKTGLGPATPTLARLCSTN